MLVPICYPVTAHTRHVGPGSTFVVIDGFKCDGMSFVCEAIERGATTIVLNDSQRGCYDMSAYKHISFQFVADCRKELARLASCALGNPSSQLHIIGITGTKGKTSTAFLVEHMLCCAGYKTALIGSIKNSILGKEVASMLTTPESDYLHLFFDQCVKQGVTHVVMEVSSHAIALERVHGISFVAVGFTNLAPEHMDFHPTMEQYFETKHRLFSFVKADGFCVVNGDDEWGKKIQSSCPIYTFGKDSFSIRTNDVTGLEILLHDTKGTLCIPNLFGMFNAYNVVMAYTIGRNLGIGHDDLVSALKTFSGIPGRLQMHRLKNGACACVDFAHNPSSFEAVLKTLRSRTNHLIVLFGCGGERDKTKRPVMGRLAALYGDEVIITDDNPRDENPESIRHEIYRGIPSDTRAITTCIPDRKVAIKRAVARSRAGSVIALLGKGHEVYYVCKGRQHRLSDFEEITTY